MTIYTTLARSPISHMNIGFSTPIFRSDKSNGMFVQVIDDQYNIEEFEEVYEDSRNVRFEGPSLTKQVGDQAVFGFRTIELSYEIGTREELRPTLEKHRSILKGTRLSKSIDTLLQGLHPPAHTKPPSTAPAARVADDDSDFPPLEDLINYPPQEFGANDVVDYFSGYNVFSISGLDIVSSNSNKIFEIATNINEKISQRDLPKKWRNNHWKDHSRLVKEACENLYAGGQCSLIRTLLGVLALHKASIAINEADGFWSNVRVEPNLYQLAHLDKYNRWNILSGHYGKYTKDDDLSKDEKSILSSADIDDWLIAHARAGHRLTLDQAQALASALNLNRAATRKWRILIPTG